MTSSTPRAVGRTLALLLVIWCAALSQSPARAEDIDYDKCLIDGVQITRNWDARYLNADAGVAVAVKGKSQEVADSLVDGQYGDGTGMAGLTWAAGDDIEISLDLQAERLLSGIVMVGRRCAASWEIAASRNGREWRAVPTEGMVDLGGRSSMIANLALPARYLRMRATAGAGGVDIVEIFVYGEERADGPVIGGIYPSRFPPVAGEEIQLRAVIRNLTANPIRNLRVRFRQTAPSAQDIGESTINELAGAGAKLATITWRPTATEPHEIEVSASGEGLAESGRTEVIPVVNRRLYFSNFFPISNKRLQYANLYTTVGGGFEYFLANIRGRLGLYAAPGPGGAGNIETGTDEFEATWLTGTRGSYRDGMAMDEWGQFWPAACEAIKRVCQQRGDRMVVPWLNRLRDVPVADTFRDVSLVLMETYLNWNWAGQGRDGAGHQYYRRVMNERVALGRERGMLDRWIIALGGFVDKDCWATTPEDIEREVRQLRREGPEMPGMCYYGSSSWALGGYVSQTDALSYKYFIAPVVVPEGPGTVAGNILQATVRNIGGMTAHSVIVVAANGDGSELGRTEIPVLRPDQEMSVAVPLRGAPVHTTAVILPATQYTALNPQTLEVIPSRPMRGLPARVLWTPPGGQGELDPTDRLELLNQTTHTVALQPAQATGQVSWDDTTWHWPDLDTSNLDPGEYCVRLIAGQTGEVRCSATFTITAPNAKFFVSQVNGKPWTGDPQEITIAPGDTFEVRWDMAEWKLSGKGGIYLSAPGDDLKMPRSDGSYALAPLPSLARVMRNISEDPYRAGRWTWPTQVGASDFIPLAPKAWIWHKGSRGANDARVSMANNPGTWRLWIGDTRPPVVPVPVVPVITVTVKP